MIWRWFYSADDQKESAWHLTCNMSSWQPGTSTEHYRHSSLCCTCSWNPGNYHLPWINVQRKQKTDVRNNTHWYNTFCTQAWARKVYLVPGCVVNSLVLGGIVVQIQLVPIECPRYKDNFALLRIKGEMFHIKWAICLHYGWEHPENAAVGSNYNIGVQEILKAIIRTKIKRQNARINERNQLYFNAIQRKKSQITTNRVLLYKYIRQCQFRRWFLEGTWFVSSRERNSSDWKISLIFFFFLKQDEACWWEYYSRL